MSAKRTWLARTTIALVDQLFLTGCIVTLDAMGCQKEIAKEIKDADADYVLALKGNHELAHAEVKSYLDDAIARKTKELVRPGRTK